MSSLLTLIIEVDKKEYKQKRERKLVNESNVVYEWLASLVVVHHVLWMIIKFMCAYCLPSCLLATNLPFLHLCIVEAEAEQQ